MAAPSLVIVQSFENFMLDPNNVSNIIFAVNYDIAFVPDENALPQARQDEISVPIAGLTKAVVMNAVQQRIIAEVAALGGSITVGRIFSVADLV